MKRQLAVLTVFLLVVFALAAAPIQQIKSTGDLPLTSFGEMSVAQNDARAAWLFAYNVNTDFISTTVKNGGVITQADSSAVLQTGTNSAGLARIQTKSVLNYTPGYGGLVRFTAVFSDGCVSNSEQIIGLGDTQDGFFVGCNGSEFGFLRRQNGADYWTAITEGSYASQTTLDTTLDPTKGNVYEINYQWLGYGAIRFSAEDSDSGAFQPLHLIKYANTYTVPSIYNPSLPLWAEVKNAGNTSDITMNTSSGLAASQGSAGNGDHSPHPLLLHRAVEISDSVSTLENVITIKNADTFHGKSNRVVVQLALFSMSTDGTKVVTVKGYKNATLGGSPSYTDYDSENSPVSYDTAGTTVSGGMLVFSSELGKTDAVMVNLHEFGIFLMPGETVTIAAESDNSSEIKLSEIWTEQY